MNYEITEYNEKSDATYIRICSLNTPMFVAHWFTDEERATEESKKDTITKLIAQLELMDEQYEEPEPFISKLEDVQKIEIKPEDVQAAKAEMLVVEASPTEEAKGEKITV